MCCLLFSVELGGGVDGEVNDTVGVAALVVVPGDELDELVVEGNAGGGIEDGGVGVTNEVAGDNFLISVAEDSLELALGGLLDGVLDLLVGGGLLKPAGEVDHRDVGVGHTEGHAGELSVQLRDDLADSLGGTSGGGDHVLTRTTAGAPVLARGTINGLLGGSDSVNGGHEALNNHKVVVDDLGQRGQAVGGAGGVRDDLHAGVELGVVDPHDEHRGVVGGGGDDDELSATSKVHGGAILGGEDSSGLNNDVSTGASPGDLLGVHLAEDGDGASVHNELAIVGLNSALEASVGGVVLGQVDHVVDGDEGVVDGHNLNIVPPKRGAEDQTSDPAKSIFDKTRHNQLSTHMPN